MRFFPTNGWFTRLLGNLVDQLPRCHNAVRSRVSLLHWHCFTVWLQSYIQQNRCAWGVIMHQWHCCRERENGSYFTYTCYVFSPLQILTTTASNSSNIARTKVQAGRDNDTLAVRSLASASAGNYYFPRPNRCAHVRARWRDDSDAEATAHTDSLSVPLCDSLSPYCALVSLHDYAVPH